MSSTSACADKPPQAALLDWLAVEFMENGWSMKKLHRLMVTSAAYRMRSPIEILCEANHKADRDNRWWWHMNDRRLEAEAIRDSILHLAGNLDTEMGGPEIPLTEGETSRRRSIYFRHAHERQIKFLNSFDGSQCLGVLSPRDDCRAATGCWRCSTARCRVRKHSCWPSNLKGQSIRQGVCECRL